MTNENILKKAIEKIIKNGWKGYWEGMPEAGLPCEAHSMESEETCVYTIIFSHDFAKAFWGEEVTGYPPQYWEKHLQEMVLEEEPLLYLKKFL